MAGTKAGAAKMWETRKARGDNLNKEHYSKMGKKSHVGGFGANPELARQVKRTYWDKRKAEQEKPKSIFGKVRKILSES